MSFAASRVYVAVEQKLYNDGTLTGLLAGDRVFAEGDVPEAATLPFITLGASEEQPDDSYGRDGNDGILTINVRASSKKTALAICEHINRLLHGVILAISGHVQIDGALAMVTDFPDPSGSHNAVLRYRAETQVAV